MGRRRGEWAEGRRKRTWAEGTGKAYRAERAELSASADGGYACRGWIIGQRWQCWRNRLRKRGVAERGLRRGGLRKRRRATLGASRGLSSVEWFVSCRSGDSATRGARLSESFASFPLSRVHHSHSPLTPLPPRSSMPLSLFPSHLLLRRCCLLWVWVLVAAAILSLVFTVAWRHAQANERDDLEAHCDEWAAFIQAKFNIMAANTRSISDFIRAYYLDK
ncbi:unnamed protein product [Closterium sp. NIES-65]|nr:unnamed protein product [Closterium sp. NIES-65]